VQLPPQKKVTVIDRKANIMNHNFMTRSMYYNHVRTKAVLILTAKGMKEKEGG
jgi:lipoate synthase